MTGLMRHEMGEQPDALRRLAARFEADKASVRRLVERDPRLVVLVGRGSSDNAATLGRYAIEMATGRPAALAAPSLSTRYRHTRECADILAIGLSQSGRTPEVTATLRDFRDAGARTVAITNDPASPLAEAAHLTLPTEAGPERAVPATKTVTAEMLTVVAVAAALGPLPLDEEDLSDLPNQVRRVLDDSAPVERLAASWTGSSTLLVAARGFLLAAAQETALKVRETTGIMAVGSSSADLVHGPIAAVHAGDAVLLLDGDPATHPDMAELRQRLAELGADHATIGTNTADIPLPSTRSPLVGPLLATIRGQQLALELATTRGLNPDSPAGLTKVTATA